MSNKYQHNPDGTTFIFIESKKHGSKKILIDTEDWDRLKGYTWSLSVIKRNGTCYAKTQIFHPDGGWIPCKRDGRRRRKTVLLLHHLILGKPKRGMVTDHINHNGLDNRKENLRFATLSQNAANCQKKKGTTSQYLGVSLYTRGEPMWHAKISCNNKRIHIGYFICEHQAALAYNKKAIELHGEFANLNVVPQEYIIKYEGEV